MDTENKKILTKSNNEYIAGNLIDVFAKSDDCQKSNQNKRNFERNIQDDDSDSDSHEANGPQAFHGAPGCSQQ